MRNQKTLKAVIIVLLSVLLALVECGLKSDSCKRDPATCLNTTFFVGKKRMGEICGLYSNSVKGHKEEQSIIGNFTGHGLDRLYVVEVWDDDYEKDLDDRIKYYAKSDNPQIPTIELCGCAFCMPKLVYEGDVDGDGKDEWGYTHTWSCSQWRYYRIYNYDNRTKKWRFLYYDCGNAPSLLDTTEAIRSSALDIVEKGPKPGTIRINYDTFRFDEGFRDSIVAPTYTPITKDNS